jgi:hypothetical protein
MSKTIKKGDVVVARDPNGLHCGSGVYTHAICISVLPFVLVSEETDMRWTQLSPKEVIPLCQAHPSIVQNCIEQRGKN